MRSALRVFLAVLAVFAVLALAEMIREEADSSRYAREKARQAWCASNLRQISSALTMYCLAHDGLTPPDPGESGGDLIAKRYTGVRKDSLTRMHFFLGVEEAGPLSPYLDESAIACCPSDPEGSKDRLFTVEHPSYQWNHALAGKRLDDVVGRPLMWDRGPWHRGGQNVAGIPSPKAETSHVSWIREQDFRAQMGQGGVNPDTGFPLPAP